MLSETSFRGVEALRMLCAKGTFTQFSSNNELFIKIGSSTLVSPEIGIRNDVLSKIASTSVALQLKGYRVHLVSSGAVASGRHAHVISNGESLSRSEAARIGQQLMRDAWQRAFRRFNLDAQYITLIDAELESVSEQLRTRLPHNIIVLNGDDVRVTEDDSFARDNDKLVTQLALIMSAARVVFLSQRSSPNVALGTGGFESKRDCIKRLHKAGIKTRLCEVDACCVLRWAE